MSAVLRLTFRTSLTDDELKLFYAWDTLESLSPENFSVSHNLPYTHGLSAGAVTRVTDGLIQRGLIRCRTEHGPPADFTRLTLTAAGGSLWTLEREPAWDRYCTDGSWPTDAGDGSWTLSVRSPRLDTARAFLSTARRCGLHAVSLEQPPRDTTSVEDLIPWHIFAVAYELQVPVSSPRSERVDWALYERSALGGVPFTTSVRLPPNAAGAIAR